MPDPAPPETASDRNRNGFARPQEPARTITSHTQFKIPFPLVTAAFLASLSPFPTSLPTIMNHSLLTMVISPQTVALIEMIMVSPAASRSGEKGGARLAVVVTVAKGYDLGYIW